jgi:hypothetical protein
VLGDHRDDGRGTELLDQRPDPVRQAGKCLN